MIYIMFYVCTIFETPKKDRELGERPLEEQRR